MPDIPTGTVTFLFTDIEGSTRLWEEQPDAMRIALAWHDSLLREAIEQNDGLIFKMVGDAFCAAFQHASDAVYAASAAQQALSSTSVPGDLALKVRMALHTGSVESRDHDYFGQPLNRVARLLSIGHGGQVLLSDVAHDLCRDSLPSGCTLKPLGEHRLKDLGRAETVFQLCHPKLPADFPPPRSLDNPDLKHNLPIQVTSFIGREKELGEIKALLEKTRLLTLTGSGGCGKTRLALHAAADMLDGSGDGVWLVELAALSDPALMPQAVANVLGLKEEPGKTLTETLTERLKPKHLLVLLDNCEHLLDACARLADTLLRHCPRVLILATSREGLGIDGELTYRVPSLSLPDPKRDTTPESLSQYEAVRLFIERAQFHQPQFAITNQNAPALASVCYRLDGIPLAIELAAARVRSLTVEDIHSRLDQRFRLLTGGSRTALPRQQTLRSMIDWSYDLLAEAEQALLYRLSVFVGGWTLAAAEAVCGSLEVWECGSADVRRRESMEVTSNASQLHTTTPPHVHTDILDQLTSLADKSLVVAETAASTVRYRLLETVRQYARDRLLESGEGEEWRGRHLEYFVTLGEEAEPNLTFGGAQQVWLERLEAEHDNLRAALEWSTVSDPEAGLKLAGAIWRFWTTRGHLDEGRTRLAGLHAVAAPGVRSGERARAMNGAGALAYCQGDYVTAQALYEEGLAIRREICDQVGIAASLGNLGMVAHDHGDYAVARALYEEGLAIFRELGDRAGIAFSLGYLATVTHDEGDSGAARPLFEESLAILRELGDQEGIAASLGGLGIVARAQGDHTAARALYKESLAIRRALGDRSGIAHSLDGVASVEAATGDGRRAARLWGAAEQLREAIGSPLPPDERSKYEARVAAARAAMGEDAAFDAAWQEGRAMTVEEAFELALEEPA